MHFVTLPKETTSSLIVVLSTPPDSALRDDFFTAPFGHPSYVILDGNLKVRHKIIGPCCGYEDYYACSADTARSLEPILVDYIDAILDEEVVSSGFEEPDPASAPETSQTPQSDNEDCVFSSWSDCSVTCGEGIQFRWRTTEGDCGEPVKTRRCSLEDCDPADCIGEFGATWEVKTVADGFDGPRDVAL